MEIIKKILFKLQDWLKIKPNLMQIILFGAVALLLSFPKTQEVLWSNWDYVIELISPEAVTPDTIFIEVPIPEVVDTTTAVLDTTAVD